MPQATTNSRRTGGGRRRWMLKINWSIITQTYASEVYGALRRWVNKTSLRNARPFHTLVPRRPGLRPLPALRAAVELSHVRHAHRCIKMVDVHACMVTAHAVERESHGSRSRACWRHQCGCRIALKCSIASKRITRRALHKGSQPRYLA